jgi:tetratricopeptide (TPR) repeat protein
VVSKLVTINIIQIVALRINKFFLFSLIVTAVLLSGCVAIQDTGLARFYHNVTARYNIYFNAYQKYLVIIEETEKSFVDDYNFILPVYRFPDEVSAKSNSSEADEIVKKCSKILDKHKMSKWVDDSYFLIARAYFYKGDYYSAMETFQYVINEYENSDLAYESLIWLAKCNYQLKKYDQATARISQIKSMQGLPDKLGKELRLLEAYLNIEQQDYVSAISNLKKALKQENKKDHKTRYTFILAQLYQRMGQFDEAIESYEKVIKKNPPYDMAFNAKIEVSRCFEVLDEKTARAIKARLEKMLKDDKNIQYFDQIYFEMALVDLKTGNEKSAEKNLKLSLQHNKNNNNQKAFAFLKLAEFYFDKPNYALSKSYYDSAATFLNADFAGYNDLKQNSKVLSELVKHLVVVETQDSLLYLASLPAKSRDSLIDIVWQAEEKAKREAELAEQQQKIQEEQEMRYNRDVMMGQNRTMMQPPSMGGLSASNKWYFYNKSAVELGKSEFAVKWGKRKLEDNWRRKKKLGSISDDEFAQDSTSQEEEIVVVLTEEEKKFISEQLKNIPQPKQKYYMDIPFTESQVSGAHRKILESLKKIGDIYLEKLNDTVNATASYEKLLNRYWNSKYDAQTHYSLYTLYSPVKESALKNAHKDTILRKYPDSDYAILVKDPSYFNRMASVKSKEIKQLYNQSYDLYLSGNCKELLENIKISQEKYPGNKRQGHFKYLGVLCSGKNKSKEEFIQLLQEFISENKDKELDDHAQNIINYLKGDYEYTEQSEEAPTSARKDVDSFLLKVPYKQNPGAPHYFVYFFDSRKVNTNSLKMAFSDYNKEYYSTENYSINTVLLNKTQMMLLVQQFDHASPGLKYLNNIKTDKAFLEKIKNRSPRMAVISQENFAYLMQEKKAGAYLEFFRRYY